MWMKADEAELIPWASSMHVEWRTERDDNILDYDTIIEFLVSKFKHDMFKETNHMKNGLVWCMHKIFLGDPEAVGTKIVSVFTSRPSTYYVKMLLAFFT